jgi:hypothetical protein
MSFLFPPFIFSFLFFLCFFIFSHWHTYFLFYILQFFGWEVSPEYIIYKICWGITFWKILSNKKLCVCYREICYIKVALQKFSYVRVLWKSCHYSLSIKLSKKILKMLWLEIEVISNVWQNKSYWYNFVIFDFV